MMEYHGVIFTDNAGSTSPDYTKEEGLLPRVERTYFGKAIGAYRLRTEAAYHGYNIRIVDMLYSLSSDEILDILDHLISSKTKFIGFSATFIHMKSDGLIQKIKSKYSSLKLVLGGGMINTKTYYRFNKAFNITPDQFDYVIYGFAEKAFIHLINYLENKTSNLITEQLPQYPNTHFINGKKYGFEIDNLRTVWLPEDSIDEHDYLPIEISRGCIFKCSFCSFELNGKKKFDYFRRIEEIEQEIRYNYENFGVTEYTFLDDTYNDSREKIDLMNEVLSRLDFKITFACYLKPELLVSFPEHKEILIEQGLRSADLGVESFHPEARKAFGKGRNLDAMLDSVEHMWKYSNKKIRNRFFLIVGAPYEPIESCMSTLEYCKNSNWVHNVGFNPLIIMNHDPSEEFNYSLIDQNPSKYGYKVPYMKENGNVNWVNEYTSYEEVVELERKTQPEIDKWRQPAGFKKARLATILGEHKHEYLETQELDVNLYSYAKLYTENRNKIRKQKMLDCIFNDVRTSINIQYNGVQIKQVDV